MRRLAIVGALLLAGCANHPVDCAVGFHHADCLPGTAGYSDPGKFSQVDDQQCQSYGFKPGTEGYGDCRLKLRHEHAKGF